MGVLAVIGWSCSKNGTSEPARLYVDSLFINNARISDNSVVAGVALTPVVIRIVFSSAIELSEMNTGYVSFSGTLGNNYTYRRGIDNKTLILTTESRPQALTAYDFSILKGDYLGGSVASSFQAKLVAGIDSTPKYETITDDALLSLVQRQTYKYFYNYAHPVSGLARERLGSGDIVTTGGSGFGLMATLVAIERGFISRGQGFGLLNQIVTFLNEKADKFHGAFPHWLNGTTGKVQPFSTKDNGADLIETSFLMQGLLTVREYFKNGSQTEKNMCDTIQKLWHNVEWTWFQQNGQNRLYWHWSPDYGWAMNMPITGWNEGLIAYVLAASSPTFPIAKAVYDNGWAQNGNIRNGRIFYNTLLPLGENRGGPLFFAHYSFLGLDPRNLSDTYAGYWIQNVAHSRINHFYCVDNPLGYWGYSSGCWGLTASDVPDGYNASSPNNDVGVIAPTAALSSFPYTPAESMRALHFFYYTLGDRLWGEYGFKDAFCLSQPWFADSYLAIDQGPVVVMIENYRSALLWNLFMQNSDIRTGLTRLGFSY